MVRSKREKKPSNKSLAKSLYNFNFCSSASCFWDFAYSIWTNIENHPNFITNDEIDQKMSCEEGRASCPAALTLIVDRGGKQLNCKTGFKICHCLQRELRTLFFFDIILFQLTAALHQCCHYNEIRKGLSSSLSDGRWQAKCKHCSTVTSSYVENSTSAKGYVGWIYPPSGSFCFPLCQTNSLTN